MEIITMESSAFKALTEQIAEIAGYIRKNEKTKSDKPERLIGTEEAARLLNVSRRTLQRMRDENRIRYAVLRGKCQYRLSDIDKMLEKNTIREKEETFNNIVHNHEVRSGHNNK
ncbi:MAG: helix-turn-helix domain-containing protein [Bacteroidales bacterium]|nr:helix-turn-helix domain-containing protein [Bacteroidales bacterium]